MKLYQFRIGKRFFFGCVSFHGLFALCIRLSMAGQPLVDGTQWDNKKHMNIKHLEMAFEDVSIAG